MFPKNEVNILIARISSISNINPLNPLIEMTRRNHYTCPKGYIAFVQDWVNCIVSAEKARSPPNAVLRFFDYNLLINDSELFKIGRNRYDEVILIIGEESCYWIFNQTTKPFSHEQGQAILPLSYCVCCFQNHFGKVMRLVKESFCKP